MPKDAQQQGKPQIDKQAQAKLLHKLRYNFLGYKTLKEISELLGISDRHLRNLLHEDVDLQSSMFDRIAIIAFVHWQSPVPIVSTEIAKLARYALDRTFTKNDLHELEARLNLLLIDPTFANDYGLLHINALVNFAIWQLCTDFNNQEQILKNSKFLDSAINRWDQAYISAKAASANELVSMLFKLNNISATINYKYYCLDNRTPHPDQNYRAVLHDYIDKCLRLLGRNGAIAALHTCRDLLEQSVIMNDQNAIKEDFILLTKAIEAVEEPRITKKELEEVLLTELSQIDGADALKKCSAFQEWIRQIQ